MSDTPQRTPIELSGGKNSEIGVLVLHGFLGSPASVAPWVHGLHAAGFTVSAPCLAGHQESWQGLNHSSWEDWYDSAEKSFLELSRRCERVFVAGFSMGGALALRLSQIRGSEITGTILLNASIYDERPAMRLVPVISKFISSIPGGVTDVAKPNPPRHVFNRIPLRALHSLQKLWRITEDNLYQVDLPLMVAYSLEDHTVHPTNSETIIDNVFSVDIREVVFENSYHNVALDHDAQLLIEESVLFIQDVISGELSRGESIDEADERELIDAEFESIVSGLSLDESAPTTYLDQLENFEDLDSFTPPNPDLGPTDKNSRLATLATVGGLLYIFIVQLLDFDPIGLGSWPGILAFIGGIAMRIWSSAQRDEDVDEGDDGAKI
ncbi:unannotated protein [freshwater metagenome]|uniref:Unannotated protein n=2 Tax=freshwater metagenome TaxID=449393 RepID=A0A6J7QFR3_9ZZZZ|nr:alpha/beta fold hydrolase [Actinomycetota bacterium]MSW98261.1 alpha/beta fold hydrolase [Actinomycetota bacterium]MSY81822.1 alpha/beta fold hydrolase [Actinomycetota bacterium]MSZ45263.1 alpha/beta fold hydrolase [Actinomycetota bacterium]MTA04022.1 alpha/beta fold hydrolase [Actinomycetota bacterium]